MSLRSRSRSSNSENGNGYDDHIKGFKSYSFTYQEDNSVQESGYDEDDDLGSSYLEKEAALKKINEELEKKTNEIFRKIEKYRSRDDEVSFDLFPRINYILSLNFS